jgi:uncharacterized membrane protein
MGKGRLEAFSDGVIAILMTVMVLEIRAPRAADLAALLALAPSLLVYALSFAFLGVYWVNHHHLLQAAPRVNGRILWANLHLLFWLSLMPIAASWLGEHPRDVLPTIAYGALMLMAAVGFRVLLGEIVRVVGLDSKLALAVGSDQKGKLSVLLCATAIALASVQHWASLALYVVLTVMWLVPDRRMEQALVATRGTLDQGAEAC